MQYKPDFCRPFAKDMQPTTEICCTKPTHHSQINPTPNDTYKYDHFKTIHKNNYETHSLTISAQPLTTDLSPHAKERMKQRGAATPSHHGMGREHNSYDENSSRRLKIKLRIP